jgi:initiation factor 1A
MVRNTKGGSSHKKMASKNAKMNLGYRKLRKVKEEGEDYAIVVRNLGGGHCLIKNNCDGKERMCVIRGKFKGRNKRGNQIIEGSIVLVGLRSWEIVKPGKLEKCDLLEVYATTQQKELKELKEWNLTEDTKNQNDIDGNIEFTNDEDIEDYLKSDTKTQDVSTLKKELEEGEFDWDDI